MSVKHFYEVEVKKNNGKCRVCGKKEAKKKGRCEDCNYKNLEPHE